ncbi:sulfur carrier protein ThiS [Corynebacterium parakroppenstedtii]|uniref:sulfur carrier protein ThiS n=1 Tax=Corynebacterium parakroppenstedtii TaxID=2828363 RepID=UPI001C8E5646|nr:sulfur carrier protein ThiS [Corynebacterium parakroppenstedtii]MBY0788354.1 sulfur carrier protein ThiS [Corynebacterium parakroppenstedtii]
MTDTSSPTVTIELNGTSHRATSDLTVRSLVKAVSQDGDNADLTALANTAKHSPTSNDAASDDDFDGYAVAINDEIVPKSTWQTVTISDGDRIELLTAVQGG